MIFRASVIGMLLLMFAAAYGQTNVDRSFSVTSKNCEGVQWDEAALEKYPNLAGACQSVEERDGKSYVRFQGTVVRNVDRGKEVQVRIKGGDTVTFTPPADMTVYINDRQKSVSALARGDELNFYIPEDRFAAQFAQDTTPAPRYVIVPIVFHEVSEELPEQTAQASELPATASNRGALVLLGGGLIAFAMVLTFGRARKQHW